MVRDREGMRPWAERALPTATDIPVPAGPPRTSGAAGARSRGSRLLRAHPADPAWARPALAGLLLATALLYMVGLDRNGWGNEFYAAAVQAGTKSWKAFLFGSLDSSNFITVDKPAGFLWVMELSGRIFGFNYWSVLLPQALAGVATAGVLYTTVRRWFGPGAGLVAGAVMALAPVATLMFRFDDPDALLTLTITLAGYAVTRAIESGRTRWVVLAGVFLGAGFLSKMLAAFMVLPALALAYLWAGPPRLGKRIWQLLAGGVAVLVTAGWWVLVLLLTPAGDRPFIGSSTDNNILNLIFVYNGFGRLTGNGFGRGVAAGVEEAERAATVTPRFGGAANPFGGSSGITRLFSAQYGGQVAWLIPAALIALVVMLWVSRRASRTDRTRAAALLWGGWLLVAGLVLSFMSGISHTYYVVALTPAIGALTGIGAAKLWEVRRTWFARVTLAVTLLVTGAWAWVLLGRSPGWFPWLRVVIVIAAVGAAALILAEPALRSRAPRGRGRGVLAAVPVSLALAAGLAGPLAYSIDTASTSHSGASPSAGPSEAAAFGGLAGRSGFAGPGRALPGTGGEFGEFGRDRFAGFGDGTPGAASGRPLGGGGGGGGFGGTASVNAAVTKLLETGSSGYKWAAATDGSDSAAALELSTGGVPVMAIGGFSGADPAPTLAEFKQLVSAHEIHYFVAGGGFGGAGGFGGGGTGGAAAGDRSARGDRSAAGDSSAAGGFPAAAGRGGSASYSAQITAWVEANFTAQTVGGETVYDLANPRT
jgi:4-amino-4-deoxy-L-arabinose transferase-like glycosyltransferase